MVETEDRTQGRKERRKKEGAEKKVQKKEVDKQGEIKAIGYFNAWNRNKKEREQGTRD